MNKSSTARRNETMSDAASTPHSEMTSELTENIYGRSMRGYRISKGDGEQECCVLHCNQLVMCHKEFLGVMLFLEACNGSRRESTYMCVTVINFGRGG